MTAKDVLLELKEKLEKAGFKTSWEDPFMKWVPLIGDFAGGPFNLKLKTEN